MIPIGSPGAPFYIPTLVVNNWDPIEQGSIQLTWYNPNPATTNVEFFDGVTSLGTVSSAPWEITDSNIAIGSHTFRAVSTPGSLISGDVIVTVAPSPPTVISPITETVPPGSVALDATTVDDSVTSGVEADITGPLGYSLVINLTLALGHWTGTWDSTGLPDGSYNLVFIRHTSGGDAFAVPVVVTLSSAFTVVQDVVFTDGTWTSPTTFQDLSGNANQFDIVIRGNGGGGKTAVGGGGGSPTVLTHASGSPSTEYSVSGIDIVGADTDGGTITFGTGPIASCPGGKSQTNGGTGPTTGFIGDTAYAGGTATTGSGNTFGGGSAGTGGAASGTNGGQPDGSTTNGFSNGATSAEVPGAGGGSAATVSRAGVTGWVSVIYMTPIDSGYSRIPNVPITTRDTANGLTRAITLPGGSGGMIIIAVAGAGAATVSMAAPWTALTQASQGSVELALFYAVDTGSLSTTVTTSSSVMCTMRAWRVFGSSGGSPGTPFWTTATGNSTSVAPPAASGSSAKYLVIAMGAISHNRNLAISATPVNYASMRIAPAYVANGPAMVSYERYVTTTSEAPGAVTIGTAFPWAAGTLMIPPS